MNKHYTEVINSNLAVQEISLSLISYLNTEYGARNGFNIYIKGGTAYALWLNDATNGMAAPTVNELDTSIKKMLRIKSDLDANIDAKNPGDFARLIQGFDTIIGNRTETNLMSTSIAAFVAAYRSHIEPIPFDGEYEFQQIQAVKIFREDMPFALYRLFAIYYNCSTGYFVVAELVDIAIVKAYDDWAKPKMNMEVRVTHVWSLGEGGLIKTPLRDEKRLSIMNINEIKKDLKVMIEDPNEAAQAKRGARMERAAAFDAALCLGLISKANASVPGVLNKLFPIVGPLISKCNIDPVKLLIACKKPDAKDTVGNIIEYFNWIYKNNVATIFRRGSGSLTCYQSLQYYKNIRSYYAHPYLIDYITRTAISTYDTPVNKQLLENYIRDYERVNQRTCELLQARIFEELHTLAIKYKDDIDIVFSGGYATHLYSTYVTNTRYKTADIDVVIIVKREDARKDIYYSISEMCVKIKTLAIIELRTNPSETYDSSADTDDDFYRGVIVNGANAFEVHVWSSLNIPVKRLMDRVNIYIVTIDYLLEKCAKIWDDDTQNVRTRTKYMNRYFTMLEIKTMLAHVDGLATYNEDDFGTALTAYPQRVLLEEGRKAFFDEIHGLKERIVSQMERLMYHYEETLHAVAVLSPAEASAVAAEKAVTDAAAKSEAINTGITAGITADRLKALWADCLTDFMPAEEGAGAGAGAVEEAKEAEAEEESEESKEMEEEGEGEEVVAAVDDAMEKLNDAAVKADMNTRLEEGLEDLTLTAKETTDAAVEAVIKVEATTDKAKIDGLTTAVKLAADRVAHEAIAKVVANKAAAEAAAAEAATKAKEATTKAKEAVERAKAAKEPPRGKNLKWWNEKVYLDRITRKSMELSKEYQTRFKALSDLNKLRREEAERIRKEIAEEYKIMLANDKATRTAKQEEEKEAKLKAYNELVRMYASHPRGCKAAMEEAKDVVLGKKRRPSTITNTNPKRGGFRSSIKQRHVRKTQKRLNRFRSRTKYHTQKNRKV